MDDGSALYIHGLLNASRPQRHQHVAHIAHLHGDIGAGFGKAFRIHQHAVVSGLQVGNAKLASAVCRDLAFNSRAKGANDYGGGGNPAMRRILYFAL